MQASNQALCKDASGWSSPIQRALWLATGILENRRWLQPGERVGNTGADPSPYYQQPRVPPPQVDLKRQLNKTVVRKNKHVYRSSTMSGTPRRDLPIRFTRFHGETRPLHLACVHFWTPDTAGNFVPLACSSEASTSAASLLLASLLCVDGASLPSNCIDYRRLSVLREKSHSMWHVWLIISVFSLAVYGGDRE